MPSESERTAARELRHRTALLVRAAGYGSADPLVVGVRRAGPEPVVLASGRSGTGEPLGAGTVLYTASLAKQVTAACAALFVQQGRLDPGSSLRQWVPELPAWAGAVRVRHLVWHTSGLPEGVEFDELHRAGLDRTTSRILTALGRSDRLVDAPGTVHRYCNAGYVCLALVVERATGRPFADVAREHVLGPLGMTDSLFWAGAAPHPPGAAPLEPGYPSPLSLGDGGLWSTAVDLLRWNDAMERDELGVAALVTTPGQLDDGTTLDYAWGVGVREHAGQRVYRHGGRWAGLSAQLVRIAGQGSGVVLALDDEEDRMTALASALVEELTG